jgi:hypothetical protein
MRYTGAQLMIADRNVITNCDISLQELLDLTSMSLYVLTTWSLQAATEPVGVCTLLNVTLSMVEGIQAAGHGFVTSVLQSFIELTSVNHFPRRLNCTLLSQVLLPQSAVYTHLLYGKRIVLSISCTVVGRVSFHTLCEFWLCLFARARARVVWSENTCYHQHGRVSLNQLRITASRLFVIVLQFLINIIINIIIISLIDSYMEPHALHATFTCHRLTEDILSKGRMVQLDKIRVAFGKLRDSEKYKILFISTKKINFIFSNIPKIF